MNLKKPYKIRSRKITQSAKGENCTLRIDGVCNHNPETVVFAHIDRNKGMGTKNHDLFGFYCCVYCHAYHHRGLVFASDELRALMETQLRLYEKGLIKID